MSDFQIIVDEDCNLTLDYVTGKTDSVKCHCFIEQTIETQVRRKSIIK